MSEYVLVGHFDKKTEESIIKLWEKLNDDGISDYGLVYNNRRPHVTLIDLREDSIDEIIYQMDSISSEAIVLSISQIATFINSQTLFYGIELNSELKNFHEQLVNQLKSFVIEESYYLPYRWVPHTTIASRLGDKEMINAFSLGRAVDLDNVQLCSIALLEIVTKNEVNLIYERSLNAL